MVVAHNLLAMNANRQLGVVTGSRKKSTEKLSSGYRINRAADDAAGLTISEKMRSQIRGLTQASTNCQDGVSLCQVADGALNETHSILQRMNELCIKSANGTNTDADREAIQNEVEQLSTEIDRIANSTTFNDKLFPLNAPTFNRQFSQATVSLCLTKGGTVNGVSYNPGDIAQITGLTISDEYESWIQTKTGFRSSKSLDEPYYEVTSKYDLYDLKMSDLQKSDEGFVNFTDNNGDTRWLYISPTPWISAVTKKPSGDATNAVKYLDNTVDIQAGAANKEEQQIPIKFVDATNAGIGLADPAIDVSTKDGALSAIDRVAKAINIVSNYRSSFGSSQNRLEHTISNLDNIVENTQTAESQIRDTDMAKEMVEYSKQDILMQAGTSMLSSANQNAQNVLSLLQ